MNKKKDGLVVLVYTFYLLLSISIIISVTPLLIKFPIDCSSVQPCLVLLRGVFILAALASFLALIPFALKRLWTWNGEHAEPMHETQKVYYPYGATRPVGWVVFAWLIISLLSLAFAFWDPWLLHKQETTHLYEMLLAISSAGAGSSVATIMAYLNHASRKGDFTYAFVPWYLMRPLLGGLLGLIFYFLMRGGLIALLETPPQDGGNLDDLALAGISALVGLFSNEAYMKLQEVFSTLFKVQKRNPE